MKKNESIKNTSAKLNEALDILIKELNDETNGLTKKRRNKLDTIVSKLNILLEDIIYN